MFMAKTSNNEKSVLWMFSSRDFTARRPLTLQLSLYSLHSKAQRRAVAAKCEWV